MVFLDDKEAQEKLVITSVYLLFGMALLVGSFNSITLYLFRLCVST